MDYTSESDDYGTSFNFDYSKDEFVVADTYTDQYAVNWTTEMPAHEFIHLLLPVYPEFGKRVVIQGDDYRIEINGVQSPRLVDPDLFEVSPRFVRFWLADASVAWQVMPRGDEAVTLMGIGSDRYDPHVTERLMRATGTGLVAGESADLCKQIEGALNQSSADLKSLQSIQLSQE